MRFDRDIKAWTRISTDNNCTRELLLTNHGFILESADMPEHSYHRIIRKRLRPYPEEKFVAPKIFQAIAAGEAASDAARIAAGQQRLF